MQTFDFFSATQIVFGRGTVSRVGASVAKLGSIALLVYNGGEPGGGAAGVVIQSLAAAGVKVVPLRQRGEPTVDDVDAGVRLARENGCDCLLGLGGGSAIDAAKAIAGLLTNGGAATDYMEVVGLGRKITKPAAPWVAVPTTAGTGAEVTRNAVIGYPEKKFKASIRSELLLPRVALVDPELGRGVPPEVTARCGMDALCQLVESYTSTGAQPITDALALQGIRLAGRSLARVYADGNDSAAREDMALAALLSGIALTNAGLGAVHGFAAPLGANFPAPHGAVCGILLPRVIEANVEALLDAPAADPAARRTLTRYAEAGRALCDVAPSNEAGAIEALIDSTSTLALELNIPRLGRFGLKAVDVPEIVWLARKSSSMKFNPVVLSDDALAGVLRGAI